ncbi:MAG: PAS domain S-box protein [Ignavibacteriaceae bacterium]|nr:PAS domain S-box protein [Ignavibacteriaceae bacterium]
MRKFLKNLSIKNKLTTLVLTVVIVVTVLGLSVMLYFDVTKTRDVMVENSLLKAKLVSQYCVTALIFDRKDGAEDALKKLSADQDVSNSFVFDRNNHLFAAYNKTPIDSSFFSTIDMRGKRFQFGEDYLVVKHPIIFEKKNYGTLFLRVNTSSIQSEIKSLVITVGMIGLSIIFVAYLLVLWMQSFISNPITNLSKAVKEISDKSDFSHRVIKQANDEIGVLYDEFNNMLEQINLKNSQKAVVEDALRFSKQRYKELVQNMGEGIALFDSEGKFLFTNQAADLLFGVKEGELIGKDIFSYAVPEQHKLISEEREKRRSGEKSTYEIKIANQKNETKYLLLTATPKYNDNGDFEGSFSILRDITDRKLVEYELLKAKEQAEISNKFKSEFLAQMSHEIRSPLNVILSFTSLLKEEIGTDLTLEMKTSFDCINSGAKRIIRTIDMILSMAEIQTGTFEVVPKIIDLDSDILRCLVKEYSHTAKQKGLLLNYNKKLDLTRIFADEYSVAQIFSNLLDNAIKYTKGGTIDIVLRKTGKNICIDVTDTGIGISKEYLPNLFNAFSQEEMGYNRRFDGNGLGLALVKKYCELNNAVINVKSEKDSGTTFTVEFLST